MFLLIYLRSHMLSLMWCCIISLLRSFSLQNAHDRNPRPTLRGSHWFASQGTCILANQLWPRQSISLLASAYRFACLETVKMDPRFPFSTKLLLILWVKPLIMRRSFFIRQDTVSERSSKTWAVFAIFLKCEHSKHHLTSQRTSFPVRILKGIPWHTQVCSLFSQSLVGRAFLPDGLPEEFLTWSQISPVSSSGPLLVTSTFLLVVVGYQ